LQSIRRVSEAGGSASGGKQETRSPSAPINQGSAEGAEGK